MAAMVAASSTCCASAASTSSCVVKSSVSLRKAYHGTPLKKPSASALPAVRSTYRFAPLPIRATTSSEEPSTTTEDVSSQVEDIVSDLKTKWDAVENKTTVLLYTGGAVVALWFSSTIVGAINSVPLLPKLMELVGLGYTGWFVYRYLLFKSSRKELLEDVEELKKKITGASE